MSPRRAVVAVSLLAIVSFAAGAVAGCSDDASGSTPALSLPDSGLSVTPQPGQDAAAPVDAGADVVIVPQATCSIALDATLTASITLTADDARKLWVNGTQIAATADGWGSPTTYEVTLWRHPSRKNVIAIEGDNLYTQGGADRGILADLSWANPDDAGMVHVVTDTAWRISATATADWFAIDFADGAWAVPIDQGKNGVAPWSTITGIDATAGWLWTYDSAPATNKPDTESAYARRSFYLDLHGQPSSTPVACP